MSQKQTSQQSDCDHISRVKEWGFNDNHNFCVALWDCINCGVESSTPFIDTKFVQIDHSNCTNDPCFGCKAKGLQLNTGDAGRPISDKKWTGRLAEYRHAREDGIQPACTTPEAVREAWRASETLGKAYDANTMTSTRNIKKNTVEAIKAIDKIASDD